MHPSQARQCFNIQAGMILQHEQPDPEWNGTGVAEARYKLSSFARQEVAGSSQG